MATPRISVTVNAAQVARVQSALAKLHAPELHKPVRRFLVAAGLAVLKDAAENQIIRGGRVRGPAGPRGGRGRLTDSPAHPSRLTSRSGELRRSLGPNRGLDRAGLPVYVDAGSDLVYGPVHELGLGRPVRAFLAPALEAVAPQFEGMLLRELEREQATA